jgi:hypothetical protein
MNGAKQTLLVDKSTPGHWRVTLDNPPINVIDDGMYDAFYDLVERSRRTRRSRT